MSKVVIAIASIFIAMGVLGTGFEVQELNKNLKQIIELQKQATRR